MAKLIMSLDNAVIREVPLDKERVTIGRKAAPRLGPTFQHWTKRPKLSNLPPPQAIFSPTANAVIQSYNLFSY